MITNAPLLIVAGSKGAVGSTVAAAVAAINQDPHTVLPWLTTVHWVKQGSSFPRMDFTGWDVSQKSLKQSIEYHGVLPQDKFLPYEEYIGGIDIRHPPSRDLSLYAQVQQLTSDIQDFKERCPDKHPVLINLLPACRIVNLEGCTDLDQIYSHKAALDFPDLTYILAAISAGVPVVNFTSNAVEMPLLIGEAVKAGIPWCGRDGKTGQTYLKVVLASALKARRLLVDGWYSLNILGNDDGKNLVDPDKASGKLADKTDLLDEILGYPVGQRYGISSHKVAIDYYPPRGDSKEAWDVIDFEGLFGMPMSLRLNMQLRDSILAAALVIDLALWMAALHSAGRSGLIPELGFYFKKTLGPNPPLTFQEQLANLHLLEGVCLEKMAVDIK